MSPFQGWASKTRIRHPEPEDCIASQPVNSFGLAERFPMNPDGVLKARLVSSPSPLLSSVEVEHRQQTFKTMRQGFEVQSWRFPMKAI